MNLIVQLLKGSGKEEQGNGAKVSYTVANPVVFIRGDTVVTVSKEA